MSRRKRDDEYYYKMQLLKYLKKKVKAIRKHHKRKGRNYGPMEGPSSAGDQDRNEKVVCKCEVCENEENERDSEYIVEFEDQEGEFPDEPMEHPTEEHMEEPIEENKDELQENPTGNPIEEPMEEPMEEHVEEPIEEPAVDPIEEPAEELIEEPAEEPIEEPAEEPLGFEVDDSDSEAEEAPREQAGRAMADLTPEEAKQRIPQACMSVIRAIDVFVTNNNYPEFLRLLKRALKEVAMLSQIILQGIPKSPERTLCSDRDIG